MILWVTWPNKQWHGTEEQWLFNQVKGQSHKVQHKEKDVTNFLKYR